ncbi:MAG: hypothetical protein ACRDR6_17090 [Pseudonocardiaceae bacterium]
MSKASDALAARAARTAARPPTPEPTTETAPLVAPRAQPVRITLDLSPITHHNLLDWCRQAAVTLQLPKVPAASLIRALLVQLDHDPALAERVLPDVLRDVEENRRRK